jgi:hypothetical protein
MTHYNYLAKEATTEDWVVMPEYKFQEPSTNTITCMAGTIEMLKIGPDGFWVRGVKVKQDDKEAEIVYNAFKQFLVWAELNRR